MTLMSRKVDYALLILSYLYRKPLGGSAREIAECFELSRAFVANILKELCQTGFVTSHRGVKGGYVLQRPASDINLAELMNALDDSFRFAECCDPVPNDGCTKVTICPVKQAIGEVHQRIRETLRTIKLAELFQPPAPADGLQVGLEALLSARPVSVLTD
jgi:Rrf2 family transcriptional regulator, cysteine metabolism repressor